MNILLLNMPVRFNSWQNLEMPLGVAYIASALEKYGHQVTIKDYEVELFNQNRFARELKNLKSDVVGVSFRTSSYTSAKKICSLVKKLNPRINIVIGGHHASAFAQDTLKDIPADFAVKGEGEYAMVELLQVLSLNKPLAEVAGLAYRYNGQIIENALRDNIVDLDQLSFPAWHLLPIEKYTTGSVLTSRGCPFSCIYCDKGVSTRKVRFRSVENVYNEIVAFEKQYKKGRIYFVDDYFFLNKRILPGLLSLILKDSRLKFRWYCQARVDGVDNLDLLRQAKDSGCEMIIYGVETGDQLELKYINKRSTLAQAERAISLTKQAGIKARANFMVGFPITTHQMIKNSIGFAKKIDADLYRFFIVSALPNTELWERVSKIHPKPSKVEWDRFDFYSPSFDTTEIKKQDLIVYVMFAYLHVLKNKVLREVTIELIPRVVKLLSLILRSRRLRGHFSVTFPACVNLLLEEWFILRNLKLRQRLLYIKQMFALAKKVERQ